MFWNTERTLSRVPEGILFKKKIWCLSECVRSRKTGTNTWMVTIQNHKSRCLCSSQEGWFPLAGAGLSLKDAVPSAAQWHWLTFCLLLPSQSAYPSCDPHTVLNPTTTIQTHLTTRSAFTRSKELALEGKMRGSEGEEKEENRVQVKVLKYERGIDRTAEVGRVPKNCTYRNIYSSKSNSGWPYSTSLTLHNT